jgi:hypothetical protein
VSHKKYRTETNCLNCGAEVTGKFCSNCGQENIELQENFFHLVFHTVGDFFHFDSKFFRSLIPLFTKPGFLTREYWQGRRAHYIHPLRLFFFVTIVMVIIASAYYKKYEQQIKSDRITVTKSEADEKEDPVARERRNKKIIEGMGKSFDYASAYLKYISFLLLPFYALAFKFLYSRHKKTYIDHVVYTLHLQSFAYIVLSVAMLIPLFITPSARSWFMDIMLLATVVYLLISLRRLYKQSWIKTVVKSVFAMMFIFGISVFFVTFVMIINIIF